MVWDVHALEAGVFKSGMYKRWAREPLGVGRTSTRGKRAGVGHTIIEAGEFKWGTYKH